MYTLSYDYRVTKDVATLPKNIRARIKKSIKEKLTTQPEIFGKPLRHSLQGLRRLRVGDYRIVFYIEIEKEIVHILLIAHRKHVYDMAEVLRRT
jgi:mRNA interferase RelE/StbE